MSVTIHTKYMECTLKAGYSDVKITRRLTFANEVIYNITELKVAVAG